MGKFIFYITVMACLISLIINLISNIGIDVSSSDILIWGLHIGAMVMLILIMLELRNNDVIEEYRASEMSAPLLTPNILSKAFKDVPAKVKKGALALIIYGVINICISLAVQTDSPAIKNGQFVLVDKDRVIQIITEQEYHAYQANIMRAFSGIWILFYSMAVVVFYEYSELSKDTDQRSSARCTDRKI